MSHLPGKAPLRMCVNVFQNQNSFPTFQNAGNIND